MVWILKKGIALVQMLQSRTFAISIFSIVMAVIVFKVTSMTSMVYVSDGMQSSITYTTQVAPAYLSSFQQIDTLSDARIPTDPGYFIQLRRNCLPTVQLTVEGQTRHFQVENGTTVGELLYREGVDYDGNDLLSLDSDKPLQNGDSVVLRRVEYEEYIEEEEIPYQTVYKNSSLLKIGRQKLLQEGANGYKQKTLIQRTVDGVQEDVQILGEKTVRAPVTETILIGASEPVSGLDFDLDMDENGRPLHYKRVLRNQVATGYSARKGAKTASGRFAIPGHVAVNPNEIPYGSKLYIVSTDGKFIYGCAIAADTGTGLMADIVDVDLFYETYQESVLNGRKYVDIYVLE